MLLGSATSATLCGAGAAAGVTPASRSEAELKPLPPAAAALPADVSRRSPAAAAPAASLLLKLKPPAKAEGECSIGLWAPPGAALVSEGRVSVAFLLVYSSASRIDESGICR